MASFSNTSTGDKTADPYLQKNIDEASLKEKVEDLIQFIDKVKFGLLTTQTANSDLLASRAMALAAKEGNGFDLLFHTNTESGKTDDLATHPSVNVGFITPSGEWASISGHATVETDRSLVKKYYSPALKAWVGDLGDGTHDGGPEDPRIGIIRVKANTAQYSVSRKGLIGSFVELAKGVSSGEAPAINKIRHISEAEVQQWRAQ
ncbi:hypothetical protein BU24DRAFT_376113 [Aaosphaeria arxii CBS 175.79]|uniref:General stress protein FMN-binding split barrel domain-containing protein n=1 Tax=Aaosphaeria arxii CBS 175.79 TaxID=1450172 RepID=A0A6A5XHN4_9PLEO|nr:uncharacterized protein BU24DRAFT_376113 [Aaosphaeria arxii CBS 175.79]KAF2012367.1 hypothetical protein BU24DRAFT_376113 [Aaosphaeria arxii CBS 175.79]